MVGVMMARHIAPGIDNTWFQFLILGRELVEASPFMQSLGSGQQTTKLRSQKLSQCQFLCGQVGECQNFVRNFWGDSGNPIRGFDRSDNVEMSDLRKSALLN